MARTSSTRSTGRTRIDGVLVVGGGYAGVHAAQAAARAGADVTVLDPTGHYDFLPRLAGVAGGTFDVDDAGAPLSEFLDGVADLSIGRAVGVGDGVVELDDGRTVHADAVVVTAGAISLDAPVEGLRLARPLRTSDDALALRADIDAADGLVVIGGGATGVQLAGAAAHRHPDLTVTIVEREPQLLGGMGDDLAAGAADILRARGVTVRTATEVGEIVDDGVHLRSVDGPDDAEPEFVRGMAAWAAGVDARADALGLPTAEGRIDVDERLLVAGFRATFAAGDVARHVANDGSTLPQSAQIAVRAGAAAGRNAARLVAGDEPEAASLSHQGWVLDLGGGRGVARLGPLPVVGSVPVAGWPFDRVVPLLHGAIDAKHLSEIGGLTALVRHRTGRP